VGQEELFGDLPAGKPGGGQQGDLASSVSTGT
jgi:hypothetical protein